jgi:hypothetical protein
LRQPELVVSLARHGLQQVKTVDWTVVLPRWDKLLEGLLAGPRSVSRRAVGDNAPRNEGFSVPP